MRFFLFIISFALMSFNANAQNYNVNIRTSDKIQINKIYLLSMDTHEVIDSADITDNGCTFKGNLKHVKPVLLTGDTNGIKQIFPFTLDSYDTFINISEENISINGSEINNRYNDIIKQIDKETAVLNKIQKEANILAEKFNQNIPDTIISVLDKKWNKSVNEYTNIVKNAINNNKDNFIPIFYLNSFGDNLETEYIENFLKDYQYKESKALSKIHLLLESNKRKAIGAMYTDLNLKDSKGNIHKLSDYAGKGKIILIDFWASWCGPCRAEMPHVKKAYEMFKDKGFDIIGISLDNNKVAWERSIKQMGMTWHQFSDLKGWECEAVDIYGIKGIPATILIGSDGKIIATDLRGKQLIEKLSELYK